MKLFNKNFAVVAATFALALCAQAVQPVMQVINIPFTVSPTTALAAPIVYAEAPTAVTTASGAVVTNLDLRFQSQFTLYGSVTTVSNSVGTPIGTYTFSTQVSPDNVLWVPGTQFVLTTGAAGTGVSVSNYPATTFRYWQITQVSATVTNSFVTNSPSGFSLKAFWKTP